MKRWILGQNPWFVLSAGAFLSSLFLLLYKSGMDEFSLTHDLATIAAAHVYVFTIIIIAGRILTPRGLEDWRKLGEIALVIRYIPFVVQLMFFATRSPFAAHLAGINFILFIVQTEMIARWCDFSRDRFFWWAQHISITGPVLLLPILIRPGREAADPRWIEAAWFWIAGGLLLLLRARRSPEPAGDRALFPTLAHIIALPCSLLAPMAVGLLTARAVVLLPMFMALTALAANELRRCLADPSEEAFFTAAPGILSGFIVFCAWFPGYALLPWLDLPQALLLWSLIIGWTNGRDRTYLVAAPVGFCFRALAQGVRSGALNIGWLMMIASYAALIPGVKRAMKKNNPAAAETDIS